MDSSLRLRRIVAPLLLVLALSGMVAESFGHHHDLGAGSGHETGHEVEVFVCPTDGHGRALHVEAPRPAQVSLCEVCILRSQVRGAEVTLVTDGSSTPDPASWVVGTDPRIASLGTAGPPGSRGPPSPTAVS